MPVRLRTVKPGYLIIAVSTVLALVVWTVDALLDHLFLYDASLTQMLITDVPRFEAITRSLSVAYLLVLGGLMAKAVQKARAAETALREHSEQLEAMVRERTSQLRDAQEHLIRQEKLAALGQLAGGVAHELRTPLGTISNAAYFLSRVIKDPVPDIEETLAILDKEVRACEKFIGNLLGFARLSPPVQRQVDINEIIEHTLSRIEVAEGIEIIQLLEDPLPPIMADADQLFQVFNNLINNAIQAMPNGGRLTVRTQYPTSGWTVASVGDSGIGIPAEHMDRLFEPLFTTKAKGIGFGLAIVRELVEAHGGTINVTSQVGQGSTFAVSLPTTSDSATEDEG